MSLEKNIADFADAAKQRKRIIDDAVEFYNSDSFQWIKYPQKSESNRIGETKSAVYAFFVRNPGEHADNILATVNDAKLANKKNKLPKLNKDYKESFEEKGCLYIGSVTSKTLEERIKQHWREEEGDVANSTYALKLCNWIESAKMDKTDITVYCCDMADQEAEIIRTVEDCLATMYQPLLGKRGDSPKM